MTRRVLYLTLATCAALSLAPRAAEGQSGVTLCSWVYASGGQMGESVWSYADIAFDPWIYDPSFPHCHDVATNPDFYSLSLSAEVSVHAPIDTWESPSYSDPFFTWAWVSVFVEDGGFGQYTTSGLLHESICVTGCHSTVAAFNQSSVLWVPYPTVQLHASNYTPQVGESVVVTATLTPSWADPEMIDWSGCDPYWGTGQCWVDTWTPGDRHVSASIHQGGAAAVVISVQAPQCVVPTLEANRGVRPGANYRYAFPPATFTGDEEQGIRDAFTNWQAANASTALGTTFQEVGWLDARDLNILKSALPPPDPAKPNEAPGAAVIGAAYGADGFLDSAAIVFNSLQQFAFTGRLGVRKGTRHEAGHLHALKDVNSSSAPSQSSVMLAPIDPNDAGNLLPDYVTSCDADAAAMAQWY